MLTGRPKTAATWSYTMTEDGQTVGRVEVSSFRDQGEIEVDGTTYDVRRSAPLVGSFVLREGEATRAQAERTPGGSDRIVVDGRTFELRILDPVRLDRVLEEHGQPIGSLRHDGTLNRPVEADLPRELAPELRLFVIWIALLTWKQNPDSFGGIH